MPFGRGRCWFGRGGGFGRGWGLGFGRGGGFGWSRGRGAMYRFSPFAPRWGWGYGARYYSPPPAAARYYGLYRW